MSRVHHSFQIRRREDIEEKSQYKKYITELREDFFQICGYCGKHEKLTKRGFEIDHFVPNNIAPELNIEYSNLVYSCFTCNRKKSGKWPTKNKNLFNDGKVGFVDPATPEYDKHVERNELGEICGKSNVGRYMCNDVFKFHSRPMKELGQCYQIIQKKDFIVNNRHLLSKGDLEKYLDIDIAFDELMGLLFEKNE